jgi:chaperonin GroEL
MKPSLHQEVCTRMTKKAFQRVVFQPSTHQSMKDGVDKIANVIRPTLGPFPRVVAIEGTDRKRVPELLDDGGVIARRIIQLPNRDEDMGAMYLRQMLWNLHEKTGDGTATAAVLFQAIFQRGVRYIVSGGNAMRLRYYLEEGLQAILNEIDAMTRPVQGKEALAQAAQTICHEPELAKMLGEIFDIIGEYGNLEIRTGRGRQLEREYHEGIHWRSEPFSREMFYDRVNLRTDLPKVAILASDLEINDPQEILPLLVRVKEHGITRLLIIAEQLSPKVISLLLSASRDPDKFKVAAVKLPGVQAAEKANALEDLVVLTGGRPVLKVTSEALENFPLEDLGNARKAWIDRHHFGVIAGRGDPRALRRHILNLKTAYNRVDDSKTRQDLQKRIGKLMGGTATLYIGGASKNEIDQRKNLAERTAQALRGVVRNGVVPGGGVALLACQPAIRQMTENITESDERAAYNILHHALEEPIRTILSNAGYEPSRILARIELSKTGNGFDVRTGEIVDISAADIWDAAAVQKAIAHSAVSSAALALTTDVLVHHKKPQQAVTP